MLFHLLYTLQQFVTALLGVSLVVVLTKSPNTSAKEKKHNVKYNVLLLAFFAATTFGAYVLNEQGHSAAATALLCVIWGVVFAGIIYAIGKARWN